MPVYRFSWKQFDDRTVVALAQKIGFSGAIDGARAYLSDKVKRPDDDFIHKTRDVIAKVWLPQQQASVGMAVVRELFDMNIGPRGEMPSDAAGCAAYVLRCRNTSGLRKLLFHRLVSFGDVDRGNEEVDDDFIPRFATIDPAKQTVVQPPPYPHQLEAWRALDKHLRNPQEAGIFKGILVMPTGSGKTHTAVHWLMQRHIESGGRVLWLAHREELLRQAARAFSGLAGLAQRPLRMRIVSSRHCRFHQIDPADDIVCCSVHSLARADDKERARLLKDPRLFVVIDEAHHAPAKSYSDAIKVLEEAGPHKLLGLTATPTRTAEDERPELSRLFGKRVLHEVTAGELIARELLARPIPSSVQTKVDAEQKMTAEDFKHIVDFHEPSAEMLAALGRDERRNIVIASHYLANREKFGKTLVFATDVVGAAKLADAFRTRGVDAEYIASWRPDRNEAERVDNRTIMDRYRDRKSGLDVLINVEMLTEGVDLPMTRTVFLARPTSSEILLRQMIGRALRGPAAGGNKEAFIVSFEDHWRLYRDYLSPIQLLTEFITDPSPAPPGTEESPAETVKVPLVSSPLAWDQVIAVGRAIRNQIGDVTADVFESVPHGMFTFDVEQEGQHTARVIHVYAHHRACWDALIMRLWSMPFADRAGVDSNAFDADFFGDVDPPSASLVDIASIIEAAKRGSDPPEYVPLEGRVQCDPTELARLAVGKDLRDSEIDKLLAERYSTLAKVIYPTLPDFSRAFDDAKRNIKNPGTARPPKGVVLFEPPPNNPLRPGPYHDLRVLLDETLVVGGELLGKPLHHDRTIEWTRRFIKGWYGMADFLGELRGRIRINVLLDSPDVSAETIRFLLWHEFLHVYLAALHTPEFRRHEEMWPDYVACNREMDSLNEKFGVQYW